MASLGPYLRELRERRGVSLDEISRSTRVGRPYLEAIEASEVDKLPAPVFARGFIRAYCQALGEPADEALARYDNRSPDDPEASRHPGRVRDDRLPARGRGPLLVSFVMLVVLGAALFAVTVVLQTGKDGATGRRAEPGRAELGPAERPPSVSTPITPSPPASPVPTPAAGSDAPAAPTPAAGAPTVAPAAPAVTSPRASEPSLATPSPAQAPPAGERVTAVRTPSQTPPSEAERLVSGTTPPYRLVARTTERTWMRVRTEDGHTSEEEIPAGQIREWVSNRRFTVTVGNARGVKLELNGRPLPLLGGAAEVVRDLVLPPQAP